MKGNNAGEWEWMPTRQIRDERKKKRLRNMKRWRKVERKKRWQRKSRIRMRVPTSWNGGQAEYIFKRPSHY